MPLTKLGRGGGVALAVDLLNSWDELEPEPDLLSTRWLRYYLDFHGVSASVGEDDIQAARDLRERLRRGFDAASEDEAVEALNAILRDFGEPPQLERVGRRWRLRYGPREGRPIDVVAPAAALGLLEAIREHGLGRFGHCSAAPCRCVFVDRSRNRSRRYCCELCADRANQAASRRRRRPGA
ncbi:MAG TPA: ABATE domain-containing protein [Gaiellaceae bacterium]